MLTESFLNLASVCCIYPSKYFGAEIARDIASILNFYEQDEDIPIHYSMKFDLVKALCKLKAAGRHTDSIFDSIKSAKKFEQLETFLFAIESKTLLDQEIQDAIKQIKLRKKLVSCLSNYSDLRGFIEDFDNNQFDSVDDALDKFGNIISTSYSAYSSQKRDDDVGSIKSLNLYDGNYEGVIEQIQNNYSGKYCIPTGFDRLDECLGGGHEPGRLYIYGGASNSGKSTLLINFIRNAINTKSKLHEGKKDLYVYITLENFIDESVLRLYCSQTSKKSGTVTDDFNNYKNKLQSTLKQVMEDNNSMLEMVYFVPTSISTSDIYIHLEELKEKYEDVAVLRGVFIDYLDLLKAGRNFDMYRLELGQITIDLKVLASSMKIPVVTLTQLNRASYSENEAPSLAMMGESIKKVENADCVGLIASVPDHKDGDKCSDLGTTKLFIGKNRSGPKNVTIDLRFNFPKYRMDDLKGIPPQCTFSEINLSSDAIL